MIPLGILSSAAVGLVPYIDITPGARNVTVPAGVTSARVTCWGAGGATLFDGENGVGGGGGALSQSIISVTPGETLQITVPSGATFSPAPCAIQRGATILVLAVSGSGASGGNPASGTGDIKYGGGGGYYSEGSGANAAGGGAAGTMDHGGSGFVSTPGAAGASDSFTDGTITITSGAGGAGTSPGNNGMAVGGGGGMWNSSSNVGADGAIVIEWGFV